MKLSFSSVFAIAAFAAVLILATPGWAGAIYNQGFCNCSTAYASQNDTNGLGLFAQTYDQWIAPVGGANLTGATWVGGYFNGTIAPPSLWTFQIYSDNGGIPGTLLYADINCGTCVNETFFGTFNGFDAYSYSITNLAFFALGGETYWISLYPYLGVPPQWGWSESAPGFPSGYQCFEGSCAFLTSTQICGLGVCNQNGPQGGISNTFSLIGTLGSTPEPSSWILMGTGVIGLAGALRRKLMRQLVPSSRDREKPAQ